jgi:hypothetical protein
MFDWRLLCIFTVLAGTTLSSDGVLADGQQKRDVTPIPPVSGLIKELEARKRESGGSLATPQSHSTSHTTSSSQGVRADAPARKSFVKETRKITAPFALATMETIKNGGTVRRGKVEVLNSPEACVGDTGHGSSIFPKTLSKACPWGVLVRLRETGDAKTEGKCFCTDQGNINAQGKILMEENGVTVGEPGTPPPASADYLDRFFAALEDNSCNKDKGNRLGMPLSGSPHKRGAPDRQVQPRVDRCKEKIKDKSKWPYNMCQCSVRRCSQMVKKSLFDAGLVGEEILAPMDAKDSKIPRILSRNGFTKCKGSRSSNPRNAPLGAVLIYDVIHKNAIGDPGLNYGHIEVRTPKGYTSDFTIHKPRTEHSTTYKIPQKNGGYKLSMNRYLKHMFVKAPVKCP